MPFSPFLHSWSPLYMLQAALTVWMLVDAHRRGVDFYWFFLIFAFQPFGAWVYFFVYKAGDFRDVRGLAGSLFHRPPSLEELRHRLDRLPTTASRLELGERLVQLGEYGEAMPHLEAVLSREPEHCQALFALAACQRGLGHPDLAVEPLRKLIARHPSWCDYKAWYELISVRNESGDRAGAVETSRELIRVAPSLGHKYLLAENLLKSGTDDEARKVLAQGLEDFQYLTGLSRRRDRRWVGRTKQLLKQID
jgi:hypothetical protein